VESVEVEVNVYKSASLRELADYGGRTTQWLAQATPEQIQLVDEVYRLAEDHYDRGGSQIVECFECSDIVEVFKTVEDARRMLPVYHERELVSRWD